MGEPVPRILLGAAGRLHDAVHCDRIPAEVCEVGEVELRPFYELEDFAPGAAIEAAKERATKLPAKAISKPRDGDRR